MIGHYPPRGFGKLRSLPVDRLERGSLQPRRMIDGRMLARLAESVRAEGIIQPIFVRKKRYGKFEIVAGERRWHAAKIAGLRQIPTLIGKVSDAAALAISLIENLHREDLNTIDQARAMRYLVDDFGMTHGEIADRIGRSRAAVSNLIRLLELPAAVRDMVANGELSMGHARALLVLPGEERESMAGYVADRRLSVRDVEAIVKGRSRLHAGPAGHEDESRWSAHDAGPPPQAHVRHISGTSAPGRRRVILRRRHDGPYRVSFDFTTREDLDAAIDELRALAARIEPSLPSAVTSDAR